MVTLWPVLHTMLTPFLWHPITYFRIRHLSLSETSFKVETVNDQPMERLNELERLYKKVTLNNTVVSYIVLWPMSYELFVIYTLH